MRNKVLYISAFLLFFVLNSGYAQKSNLSLLPSSEIELKLYEIEEGSIEKAEISSSSSMEVNTFTPNIKQNRRSSGSKEHRLCKMIGLLCTKEWSAGMIKLFRLPATTDIRIY